MINDLVHQTRTTTSLTMTVSELNKTVSTLIENQLADNMVIGEVSEFTLARSGHWYFTIKDHLSQVRCVMFSAYNRFCTIKIKIGMLIIVKAKVTLYQPKGDYQLIVSKVSLEGIGSFFKKFQQVRYELEEQGYFSQQHKKKLPSLPQKIGVITSTHGAALYDILNVFYTRAPWIEIIIIPATVQGEGTVNSLINALDQAEKIKLDAIIIGRGGGSKEDLIQFNDKKLAYRIFQHTQPIISAVGHESDVTIADLVADARAATPSVGAQMLSPDQRVLYDKVNSTSKQIYQKIINKLLNSKYHLQHMQHTLLNHQNKISQLRIVKKEQYNQLCSLYTRQLQSKKQAYRFLVDSITKQLLETQTLIHFQYEKLQRQQIGIQKAIIKKLQTVFDHLAVQNSKLINYNPEKILSKGYSITKQNNRIIKHSEMLDPQQEIDIQFSHGSVRCKIITISK